MLSPGDYVQTIRAQRQFQTVPRGTRGTVCSLDGDWLTIELPEGGRFQSHINNVNRLVRAKEAV